MLKQALLNSQRSQVINCRWWLCCPSTFLCSKDLTTMYFTINLMPKNVSHDAGGKTNIIVSLIRIFQWKVTLENVVLLLKRKNFTFLQRVTSLTNLLFVCANHDLYLIYPLYPLRFTHLICPLCHEKLATSFITEGDLVISFTVKKHCGLKSSKSTLRHHNVLYM